MLRDLHGYGSIDMKRLQRSADKFDSSLIWTLFVAAGAVMLTIVCIQFAYPTRDHKTYTEHDYDELVSQPPTEDNVCP